MSEQENDGRERAGEIDPTKLVISSSGILGFQRVSGFDEVTNFNLEVCGYVGDGDGHVIGYMITVIIAVTDPALGSSVNPSK